jgi:DNA repair protein RadD
MNPVILRPYQEEAVQAIMESMVKDRFLLLQMATGAGKTIVFCELIKRILEQYQMRICVLAHRRELVQQNADKLLKVWPDAPVGIACASLNGNANLDAPVVVGSIQTLANRLGSTAPFHLVIVDEAHRIPSVNKPSQYLSFLGTMQSYFPDLRVLGVTATPFRLGLGYIYGDKCKRDARPWFDRLHYRIGIQELQDLGFLCGIRAKEARNIDSDLRGISKSGGDFNLGELSDLMSREIHVGSAVQAYREYGEGRQHVVVFCCTIDHAAKVKDAFASSGYVSGIVHSELSLDDRDRTLGEYEAGRINVLVNVGVLQEGWDSPKTDCIILCRPTMSPALYVQQIGRALRIHPGKEDMLILDLSGNITRHGSPDAPKIIIPGTAESKDSSTSDGAGVKKCPKCKEYCGSRMSECPSCGYLFVIEQHESVQMRDVKWKRPEVLSLDVSSIEPSYFTSKAGNKMLKLSILTDIRNIQHNPIHRHCKKCKSSELMTFTLTENIIHHGKYTCSKCGLFNFWVSKPIPVSLYHFLDIEGNASGYGRMKAKAWWRQFGDDPVPETISEALGRWDELELPDSIRVVEDGRYLRWVV